MNANPWCFHGMELGDLSRIGVRDRSIGQHQTVQYCRQNLHHGKTLGTLFGGGVHDKYLAAVLVVVPLEGGEHRSNNNESIPQSRVDL